MDSRPTELERAFQLAMSGDCRSVDEIRKKLSQEGYYATQITGKSLLRQLQALIATALDARLKLRHRSSGPVVERSAVERPSSRRSAHAAIPVDGLNASNDG
jgi:hypothetical protein